MTASSVALTLWRQKYRYLYLVAEIISSFFIVMFFMLVPFSVITLILSH